MIPVLLVQLGKKELKVMLGIVDPEERQAHGDLLEYVDFLARRVNQDQRGHWVLSGHQASLDLQVFQDHKAYRDHKEFEDLLEA